MMEIAPLPGAARWFAQNKELVFTWAGAGHPGEAWQRVRDEAASRITQRLELRRDPPEAGGRVMERTRFTDEMGDFTDLAGVPPRKSLKLLWDVWDLSVGLAHGYCSWCFANDPAVIEAFPYQRLVDFAGDRVPAEMARRWRAGGGVIRRGAAVARVEDPVWASLSDFGLPFPPYRLGCTSDLQSLSQEDAAELGFRHLRPTP